MAKTDAEQLEPVSARQLEEEALAALRAEMLSPSTPSAARVSAAKTILERLDQAPGNGSRGGENDPGAMTLDEIDRELASLQ